MTRNFYFVFIFSASVFGLLLFSGCDDIYEPPAPSILPNNVVPTKDPKYVLDRHLTREELIGTYVFIVDTREALREDGD